MMSNNRRGFALPAAIGALVIVGVMVTAGFYMARQEVRVGVASKHANMAVNIAQAGVNEVLANWNGYQLGNIPIWGDTMLTDTLSSGIWTVNIINTNNFVYYVTANGRVTEGGALWAGARRDLAIITKILFANINPPAALTTRGKTVVKGTAAVVGVNTDPPDWGGYCGSFSTNDTTGVLTNDTSLIGTSGFGSIAGTPPYDQDSTLVDSTFTTFGDMDWAQLTAMAQIEGKDVSSWGTTALSPTRPDTTASGACNEADLYNWGDTLPSAPCGAYFPLIYHGGPRLTMQAGGFGQGILLIEGDLELRGNFLFYGIVIVQGTLDTQGSGNRIMGAVMASNGSIDDQTVAGGSQVTYSRCAIQRAILNNRNLARARQLENRGWVDLSQVFN